MSQKDIAAHLKITQKQVGFFLRRELKSSKKAKD